MKVLIIDDEPGVLAMYQEAAKQAPDIQLLEAQRGEEGVKIARENKPDLILLDIIMPHYNGLDVLKDLKSDSTTQNIPVYLLTNLPEESSGGKAKELGAAGYLVKAENEPKMVLDMVKKTKS